MPAWRWPDAPLTPGADLTRPRPLPSAGTEARQQESLVSQVNVLDSESPEGNSQSTRNPKMSLLQLPH